MQGYADRDPPARPVKHLAAYVVAPTGLATSFQTSIAQEAAKRGILADDAYILLPPTRSYNDAEIRKVLAATNVDAVLIINVGDTGVVREYAGTFSSGVFWFYRYQRDRYEKRKRFKCGVGRKHVGDNDWNLLPDTSLQPTNGFQGSPS